MALALQPSPKTLSPRPQAPNRPTQRANQPTRDLQLGDELEPVERTSAEPRRLPRGDAYEFARRTARLERDCREDGEFLLAAARREVVVREGERERVDARSQCEIADVGVSVEV